MSSIYKKGRDGYYYYQTYVYNPKTNKKDKRIFHALGTKDFSEAKKKQGELDLKHSEPKGKSNYSTRNLKIIRAFFLIVFLFFSITFFVELFKPVSITDEYKNSTDLTFDTIPAKKIFDTTRNYKSDTLVDDVELVSIANKDIQKVQSGKKTTLLKPDLIIPQYTIERIERLSGTFRQGKIYATVDKNSNDESLYMLCNELRKLYHEFSNIVVCLYADNDIGRNLAIGNDDLVSVQHKKKYWLAMYTFNSVEGEYFDNNPSSYLGS